MKPRLTDRVLRGIIAATSAMLAGDVASAFGTDDAETRKDWDDVARADQWARAMREHRQILKGAQ